MVKHFLADGTEVSSVAGKVIKADEYPMIYKILERTKNDVRQIRSERLAGTER